ncbi:hypothetical protein [Nannocystis bainbridge]|uniref:Uncharacterized protein n=1 Tax=Nannocystis bainbridge TaxID=2995303 RepID=A0ABT5DSX7_9BACT|nr:hypothetical protein [Nannocystis bainbridge]MDC0716248.1 hypothetical protein [Nannocystis bainbridge]
MRVLERASGLARGGEQRLAARQRHALLRVELDRGDLADPARIGMTDDRHRHAGLAL